MDVHSVDIQELCKRFNTNLDRGLTNEGAAENRKLYGPNALTPPPTTPGIRARLQGPSNGFHPHFVFFQNG